MSEAKLTESLTPSAARMILRMVNSYNDAQNVVMHQRALLEEFGMLKANGHLDTEKVVAVAQRARERDS